MAAVRQTIAFAAMYVAPANGLRALFPWLFRRRHRRRLLPSTIKLYWNIECVLYIHIIVAFEQNGCLCKWHQWSNAYAMRRMLLLEPNLSLSLARSQNANQFESLILVNIIIICVFSRSDNFCTGNGCNSSFVICPALVGFTFSECDDAIGWGRGGWWWHMVGSWKLAHAIKCKSSNLGQYIQQNLSHKFKFPT